MKRILAILLSSLFVFTTVAQETNKKPEKPQVDVDEVIRRGDAVTHTGDGIDAGEEEAIGASVALPPDDSDKWFITIFTQRDCAPCEQLKRDWGQSKELLAWARPGDQENSFAHFSEVRAEDGTQRFRLQKYAITSFPAVVLQPPLTGQYGDAATVVFQRTGYDGKPAKLAEDMANAFRSYVAKLHRNQIQSGGFGQAIGGRFDAPPGFTPNLQPAGPGVFPQGPPLQIPPAMTATAEQLRAACPGADSDWILSQLAANATVEQAQASWKSELTQRELKKMREDLEKAKAVVPQPATPIQSPAVTPSISTMSTLMATMLALLGVGGLGGLLVGGLTLYRSFRKSTGQTTILNDQQFEDLKKNLLSLQAK